MKRIKSVILTFIISILVPIGAEASSVSPSSRQVSGSFPLYKQGEVLVKFKAETSMAERERVKTLGVVASTLREIGPKDRKDIYLLKLKPNVSVEEAVKKLKSRGEVVYAEPNYLQKALYTPNDSFFTNEWGLNNTGQTINGVAGTPHADIHTPTAWDIEKGQTNPVTVAVIDSGIDFTHPDLSSKIINGYNWAGISQTNYSNYMYWAFGSSPSIKILAQSVKGTGQELTHIGIMLQKVGSPAASITVSVRSSISSPISGPDLASFTISPSEVTSSINEIYKPLSSTVTLVSGTTYYLVFQTTNNDPLNYYLLFDNWGAYSYDIYRDGQEYQWNGSQWVDSWLTDDFYFRTNPNPYPRDDNGHGTHVSGIIGAVSDNSQGIAGVSFGAKIMPLKVMDSSSSAYVADTTLAIYYAADNGAKVINMSLGGSYYSQSQQDAVNYAYGKGVVLVAAAGNGGSNTVVYPAGYTNVIGVGATTNQDLKAAFSNYNSSVDVSAPGKDIYSTTPTYPVAINSLQSYDYEDGTSMASPFVAGLAALVLSRNPTYTPLQVEQAIENNADDLGATGWDSYFGYGRINAYRTLANVVLPPPLPPPPPEPLPFTTIQYWFTWYDQASTGMQNWVLIANPGPTPISANVYLGATLLGSHTIDPGSRITPQYPGKMGGPIRVETSGPALVSQRATYNGSFNEILGTPDLKLSTQYYFSWYDAQSMRDWVLVGNPTTNPSPAQVEIWIGGVIKWSGSISPGQNVTPEFPGLMTGPVVVKSTNGVKIFASQRTVYQGSFSEVMGIPQEGLSTDLYFTWYDNVYMSSWILIMNPSATTANVTLYVGGVPDWTGTVEAGAGAGLQASGLIDGPVRVVSTNGVPIFTSERSLYGSSFEELQGLATSNFSTNFWFTWYDNVYMKSWILVGNPNPTPVNVTITIGGSTVYTGQVPANGRITPQFNLMNGPVVVASDNNVFVSQRVIFNSSFSEIFGASFTLLN